MNDTHATDPRFQPKTDAELDGMDLDDLDRYHDALLSCLVYLEARDLSTYEQEATRVGARLRAAGRAA